MRKEMGPIRRLKPAADNQLEAAGFNPQIPASPQPSIDLLKDSRT